MADHVVTARVYFADEGSAQNAFDHLVALMDHARAEGRVVGDRLDESWVRRHDCYAHEDGGWTDRCATVALEVRRQSEQGGEEWVAGVDYAVDDVVTYDGVTYTCLQAHTSQEGWEPPNAPSLWEVAS